MKLWLSPRLMAVFAKERKETYLHIATLCCLLVTLLFTNSKMACQSAWEKVDEPYGKPPRLHTAAYSRPTDCCTQTLPCCTEWQHPVSDLDYLVEGVLHQALGVLSSELIDT